MKTTPRPTLQPYLHFGGRCDDAIAFYQTALGAKLEMLMRFNESPDPPPPGMVPPGWERKVMHSSLRIGDGVIMASDGCDATVRFEGFTLSLTVATEAEADRYFAALADGGRVTMPIGRTFWSPRFGMVVDRFGVGWMVNTVPAA